MSPASIVSPARALQWAAFFGFTGVALGAFAAHALKASLSPAMLEVFKTGVWYQFVHTGALLSVAILLSQHSRSSVLSLAAVAFIIGILLFSGSLYLLAVTERTWLGVITPVGGLCFLVAWCCLFLGALAIGRQR